MAARTTNADYRVATDLATRLGLAPTLDAITVLAGTMAACREQGREEIRGLVREDATDLEPLPRD